MSPAVIQDVQQCSRCWRVHVFKHKTATICQALDLEKKNLQHQTRLEAFLRLQTELRRTQTTPSSPTFECASSFHHNLKSGK